LDTKCRNNAYQFIYDPKLTTAFIASIFTTLTNAFFANTFCAEIEVTLTKNEENT